MRCCHQLTSLPGQDVASGTGISRRLNYQDLVFSCTLSLVFALLVPVTEWPDAMEHIARMLAQQTIYPADIFSSFAGLRTPILNGEHSVFSDHYMYRPSLGYFWVNLERLPVVLALIGGLYLLAQKTGSELSLFCPPLIYALSAPSQEAIAISVLLASAVISNKCAVGAVLLAALSAALDRSMVPSAGFIVLFVVASPIRSVVADRRMVLLAALLLLIATSLVSPMDLIGVADNKTKLAFGFTVEDIRDGAEHGRHKILALAASTMGLYGWMSIRPFPFWIYYPIIIFLFAMGFVSSQPYRQSIFIALFLLSYLVLWLIPSLAQARYYPLLTMAFWGMVISGVQATKIGLRAFYSFVTLTTAAGCAVSLLGAM